MELFCLARPTLPHVAAAVQILGAHHADCNCVAYLHVAQELEDFCNTAARRVNACRRRLGESGRKAFEAALVELPPALVHLVFLFGQLTARPHECLSMSTIVAQMYMFQLHMSALFFKWDLQDMATAATPRASDRSAALDRGHAPLTNLCKSGEQRRNFVTSSVASSGSIFASV